MLSIYAVGTNRKTETQQLVNRDIDRDQSDFRWCYLLIRVPITNPNSQSSSIELW